MIEVDVYYFYWLSMAVTPLERIKPGTPWVAIAEHLMWARVAFEGMKNLSDAFPRTSEQIDEVLQIINSVFPAVGTPPEQIDMKGQFTDYQAQRLRVLSSQIAAFLRDEGKHSYVLKLEDQRCLSCFSLVENIGNCFAREAWEAISTGAKREFEECGKCLAMERYTAAGFHSLRGVECVIRQYIEVLTGGLPKKRDWGFYTQTLKDNGADPKLIAVLDNIRTLERNPLMHPEDWLEIDEAISIFTISQTAITRLGSGLRSLLPKGAPVGP
jgi:hypothetical protein